MKNNILQNGKMYIAVKVNRSQNKRKKLGEKMSSPIETNRIMLLIMYVTGETTKRFFLVE